MALPLPGERFEWLWIGARAVPGSDSVRVGVRAESGTYLDSNGGHTLDEPPRATVRQAAAAVEAACGHVTLAPPA